MEPRFNFSLKWQLWMVAEVAIPIIGLSLPCPIRLYQNNPHPILSTLASGDLLLASTLLLCTLIADVYYEIRTLKKGPPDSFDGILIFGALICLIAFVVTAFIKVAELASPTEEFRAQLTGWGGAAIFLYGFCVQLKLTLFLRSRE